MGMTELKLVRLLIKALNANVYTGVIVIRLINYSCWHLMS